MSAPQRGLQVNRGTDLDERTHISVSTCSACGRDHQDLRIAPFPWGSPGRETHIAVCPETQIAIRVWQTPAPAELHKGDRAIVTMDELPTIDPPEVLEFGTEVQVAGWSDGVVVVRGPAGEIAAIPLGQVRGALRLPSGRRPTAVVIRGRRYECPDEGTESAVAS